MLSKLPFVLTIASTLLITGCNDDDPVNDKGIEDVIEFDIDDYPNIVSTDLAGVWVAVGTGTFERDKSGDRKYGEQSAKIYFLIKGSAGSYTYANCFDEGYLEGGFNRGGFEPLRVTNGTTIEFDSDKDGIDSDDNGTDDLLSEEDDTTNTGTLTDNSEINATFTFNDGDSKEINNFVMHKVSNDSDTAIGTSIFRTDAKKAEPGVACFAQWSGSYSTSDGYYTVNSYDASFMDGDSDDPFSAAEIISDAEDITEYSNISYKEGADILMNTQSGDDVDLIFYLDTLAFSATASSSSDVNGGQILIEHDNL